MEFLDENFKKAFESARQRLLKNMPLLAREDDSVAAAAMSAGEISALESVGLSMTAWEEGAEKDPFIRSIRDYMALLETSYTTSEAAKYLKVSPSQVRWRLREGSLVGVDYEGRKRLPHFQFECGQVIPGLRAVLAALPKDLNPLDMAEWFLRSNPDLGVEDQELSPRQWLLSERAIDAVARLARGLG